GRPERPAYGDRVAGLTRLPRPRIGRPAHPPKTDADHLTRTGPAFYGIDRPGLANDEHSGHSAMTGCRQAATRSRKWSVARSRAIRWRISARLALIRVIRASCALVASCRI